MDDLKLFFAERREHLKLEQEYHEQMEELERERECLEDALEAHRTREEAQERDMESELNQVETRAVRAATEKECKARSVKRRTEAQGTLSRVTTQSQVLTYERELDHLAKLAEQHERKHTAALNGLICDVSLVKQKMKVIVNYMTERALGTISMDTASLGATDTVGEEYGEGEYDEAEEYGEVGAEFELS